MSSKELVIYHNSPAPRDPVTGKTSPVKKRRPKRKPQKRKPNKRRNFQIRPMRYHLSACAAEYLATLTNPFSLKIQNPCIPDLNETPSQKCRSIFRSTFAAGTLGFGYLLISPKAAANNSTCQIATNGSFTQSTVVTSGTGVFGSGNPQFPYTQAEMTDGSRQARLVGCAVKCSYIGTTLNQSGRLIVGRIANDNAPTNTLVGASTADLLAKQTFRPRDVLRKWQGISYIPMTVNDYEYITGSYQITTPGGENGTMIIAVDGAVAGSTFQFEIVRWHEVIPNASTALPNITRTASDIGGVSAIKNAIQDTNEDPGPGYLTLMWNKISSVTPEDVSGVTNNIKDVVAAGKLIKDLL
jgi:hypothetical protein